MKKNKIINLWNRRPPVLTLEALWAETPDCWEAALTRPLPAKPSCELLQETSKALLGLLEHLLENAFLPSQDAPDQIERAIKEVTAKLIEIARASPAAHKRSG